MFPRATIAAALKAAASTNSSRIPYGLPWCARYLPHYGFGGVEAADFHSPLCKDLQDFHSHRGSKLAVVAPREGAKSTIITLGYVLNQAAEGNERYIGVLSDSAGQASQRLDEVREELETNERLAEDYPEACGRGPTWRGDRIELRNGVVIESFGTGQRILGRRNKQHRFTLLVFDDVENTDSVMSPVKRAAAWRWATRAVIPAGSAQTNFLSVGSARHRDCVALKLGSLAGWSNRLHKAIHQWPTRMDLWLAWETIATNLADADRAATSRAFYAANEAAMNEGASVYWPSRWSLYDLMVRRSEVGRIGFDSEWNGIPGVEGGNEWPSEYFDRLNFYFDEWPDGIDVAVLALDPSKGEKTSSDFQANALVGVDRNGTIYVECWQNRHDVTAMVTHTLDLARAYKPSEVVAETNATMGLLIPEFERQCVQRQQVIPLVALHNTEPKPVRIRGVTGYLSRNQIRVRNTLGGRMLVDQWRDFPNGEFDDGADAVSIGLRRLEELLA